MSCHLATLPYPLQSCYDLDEPTIKSEITVNANLEFL